jgi:acyl carrier protein
LAAILKTVDEVVKNVTTDEDDVTTDTPFMEAGVDSLASVTLVSELTKKFKFPMAPSIIFDLPTIRALSENLARLPFMRAFCREFMFPNVSLYMTD